MVDKRGFFQRDDDRGRVVRSLNEEVIPQGLICEKDWQIFKVLGPLDFSLVGILASISKTLADCGVSIFAISTYDTDYILVKEKDIDHAVESLETARVAIIES